MAKYKCPVCKKACEDPLGCFSHKPKKPLAKTGGFKNSGKKLGRRKLTEEEKMDNKLEAEKMWNFFLYLWEKIKVKRCWACKKPIYGECLSIYFDHLLEKSVYEELKYEEENIFFCCGDCHTRKGNGFPHPVHAEAIEKAKQRFGIL